jgi:hypothetical protein
VTDLDLTPSRRAGVVEQLLSNLNTTAPTAKVALRGSLADDRADRFSDIDLVVTIDGAEFERCLLAVPAAIEQVRPIRLLRVDPETVVSPTARLIYVLFHGLPLFWRLDLEVSATSPHATAALSEVPWSLAASAVMNAIAAVKALVRGDAATAAGLLDRGFSRIGVPAGDLPPPALVLALLDACTRREPSLEDIAIEARDLCMTLLGA